MSEYDLLVLKNGGRRDFWIAHAPMVGRFIEAHAKDLTKVQVPGEVRTVAPAETPMLAHAMGRMVFHDPRGGMRMPHLHFGGEIFILSEPQWAEFSKAAVNTMTERLKGAHKVGFDAVMALSEAEAIV